MMPRTIFTPPKPVEGCAEQLFMDSSQLEPTPHLHTVIRVSLSELNDYPNHPFRLYSGEQKDDMTESIRMYGVLVPLIVREMPDGTLTILSGHNRKMCALEAGLLAVPAQIHKELSDEEAKAYVFETNLRQRSFGDMLISEQAAVLAYWHSNFSEQKRKAVQTELKKLEILHVPYNHEENPSAAPVGPRPHTRDLLSDKYHLGHTTVSRLLRIDKLPEFFKDLLGKNEISTRAGVELSFLKKKELVQLQKCVDLNQFKVDLKKASRLREFSHNGTLNEERIYQILNGELRGPRRNSNTKSVSIEKDIYKQYLYGMNATQVKQVISEALVLYFQSRGENRAKEIPTPEEGLER